MKKTNPSKGPMIHADLVHSLLAQKHTQDVYVPECKTGASWFSWGCPRLDGWAMKKSWAHPCTIGYEIKVDRSDFLGDKKWTDYLPYCNEFYFVCPHRMIAVDEVGPDVGLMWVAQSGTMLYTKKKAPYRNVEIPISIYQYLLMSRVRIIGECGHDNLQYWKDVVSQSQTGKNVGREIRCLIRKTTQKMIDDERRRNQHLQDQIENLQVIRSLLEELGWNPEKMRHWNLRSEFLQAVQGVPQGFEQDVNRVLDALTTLKLKFEKIGKEKTGEDLVP